MMNSRNYLSLLEQITPYFRKIQTKVAMSLLKALADELTQLSQKIEMLSHFYDINQEVANNLFILAKLFHLKLAVFERREIAKARLISAISLIHSSGTYQDIAAFFDKIIGEDSWILYVKEPAVILAHFKKTISRILDNFMTEDHYNLIAHLNSKEEDKNNLIVLTQDQIFYDFLQAILPAGVELKFIEEEHNGK